MLLSHSCAFQDAPSFLFHSGCSCSIPTFRCHPGCSCPIPPPPKLLQPGCSHISMHFRLVLHSVPHRLFPHFPTLDTPRAILLDCGAVPKGRAGLAPAGMSCWLYGWDGRAAAFSPCASSSLFLSLVEIPTGSPPGSVSFLGDSPCCWEELGTKQENLRQSREVCRAQIPFFHQSPAGKHDRRGEKWSRTRWGDPTFGSSWKYPSDFSQAQG